MALSAPLAGLRPAVLPSPLLAASSSRPMTSHARPFGSRKVRKGLPILPSRMRVSLKATATDDGASTPPSTAAFEALGLSEALQTAVRDMEIFSPTEIQALSFKRIMAGGDSIIASHTGEPPTPGPRTAPRSSSPGPPPDPRPRPPPPPQARGRRWRTSSPSYRPSRTRRRPGSSAAPAAPAWWSSARPGS